MDIDRAPDLRAQLAVAGSSYSHGDAGSAVLTNRALFSLTVSFLDGLPRWAIDFARRHDELARRYWRSTGLLPAIAIAVQDLEMLARLHHLYNEQRENQQRYHRASPDSRLAFDLAMTFAAEHGHITALEWLHEHTTAVCEPKTLAFAATMGRLDVVQWLAKNRKDACASVPTTPCDAMVLAGDLKLVQFMTTRFPALFLTTDAMDYAAAHGYSDIVRYLHASRVEGCSTDAMDHAARCGRLDIVRFLHEQRTEGATSQAMDFAAANGHLEVVRFLHKHRTEGCTTSAMDEAARNGHLDIVQFLHENRTEGCTTFAMDMAAARGHVDIVRFLLEHRRERGTAMALLSAAEAGHLTVVQLLHDCDPQERNCGGDALYAAARFGHVSVVEFLVHNCSRGCLVSARDCASESGHGETVELIWRHLRRGVERCGDAFHEVGAPRRWCQAEHIGTIGKQETEVAAAW